MDKVSYDYQELIPGVFMQYRKNTTPPADIHVGAFILPLITKLRKARPKWDFVCTNTVYVGAELYRFEIEQDGERLGVLWRMANYRTNTNSFCYDCPSLKQRRQRGNETSTGDINRACKEILREFKPRSLQDILKDQYLLTHGKVSTTNDRALARFEEDRRKLATSFYGFAKTQWDTYTQSFSPSASEAEAMADIPKAAAQFRTTSDMLQGWTDGNARMIFVYQGEHYTTANKDSEPTKLEEADFTPHLKKQMGILKLLEVDGLYPGAGMRIAENTFLVVVKEPDT